MIRSNWRSIFTFLVVFCDYLMTNLSFYMAVYLRFNGQFDPKNYLEPWVFINVILLPLSIALGSYRGLMQNSLENQIVHLKKLTLYTGLFTMSYLFMVKGHVYSRTVLILFLFLQYILLTTARSLLYRLNRLLVRKGFGQKKTIIIGANNQAEEFVDHLREVYGDYYMVKGFLKDGEEDVVESSIKTSVIGDISEIEDVCKNLEPEQVFIVSNSMLSKKYDRIRRVCEEHNIKVKMVSPSIKKLMRQIRLRDVTGVPLTPVGGSNHQIGAISSAKRVFDIIFVCLAGTVLLPVGLVIAIVIKVTSPGPVFFKQKRALYKGGPSFLFYKFRTMYIDAEERKKDLLDKNETDGALFKLRNDPRVTPIGRFLRKYSLDEIPQFINVLKGDMSVVGPRPLPEKDFDLIDNGKVNYDWYEKRGAAKPGITGLWQISGRSDLSFEEMCLLDLYYIENQSIFFDLEIIFDTIPDIVSGRGAY